MTAIANAGIQTALFKAPMTLISGEPVALYGTTAQSLRHPIRRIISVYHFDATTGLRVEYPASDYALVGDQISRTSGSGMYDFAEYAIAMTGATYVLVTTPPRNPPQTVYSMPYVDYETDYIAPATITGLASPAVTGLVITAGDSITGGASTPQSDLFGNDSEGYVGLLRRHFYRQFSVYNFSIAGSSIGQLTSNLSSLLAMNPSVLTVAFGQNDHVAGPSGRADFKIALTDIVTNCQSAGVRVILIGFQPKNPLWVNYSLTDIISYNDAIAEVATAKSAPFVDIYAAWALARANKDLIEMTGDNHHHPNNYGARAWFSAIMPYLLTGPLSSNDVPDYVRLS